MEAVNTLADVASKAIWGEPKQHGDEPVSGQIGDVSKGEPYDAGNIETQEKESSSQKDPSSTIKAAENESSSVHAAAADKHKDATTSGDAPSVLPSTAAADNDEDAVADPAALDKIPGPRPLDELAREGGGDAAVAQKKEHHGGSSEPEETKEDSETAEKHQGNAGGIAMGKGDGTQYVKTSGLQADGGDFDATKPGAGREAERLMEQKGIATPAAAQAAAKQQQQPAEDQSMTSKTSSGSGNSGGSGGKKGLKEKIKEKLHRN